MYDSKLEELLSSEEMLRVDPQCADQVCRGLCTGACSATCSGTCEATCAANGFW